MEYKELLEEARKCIGSNCKACFVCNGLACGNRIPGPGAKGVGDVAIRNYAKWQDIRIQMDTIAEKKDADTRCSFFGKTMEAPLFAGPVGAVQLHYSDKYSDESYNEELVMACARAGIAAFTGDGANPLVMQGATEAIKKQGGIGIPTVKPWNVAVIKEKMELIKASGAFAAAMDIDAAGLPFLKNQNLPAGSKSVEELKEIIELAGLPFIIKGIMTVKGAIKAKEAGAAGIVVSNHGGRVLDQCPSTAEVLHEIADAAGKELKIFVDGGIRTGVDVFKALALGADGVLIARPYVTAVYGGGAEGAIMYTRRIISELKDTMEMCGANSIAKISSDMIFHP